MYNVHRWHNYVHAYNYMWGLHTNFHIFWWAARLRISTVHCHWMGFPHNTNLHTIIQIIVIVKHSNRMFTASLLVKHPNRTFTVSGPMITASHQTFSEHLSDQTKFGLTNLSHSVNREVNNLTKNVWTIIISTERTCTLSPLHSIPNQLLKYCRSSSAVDMVPTWVSSCSTNTLTYVHTYHMHTVLTCLLP